MSAEMLEWLETEPDFLNQVITEDESWFFKYDLETKRQSEESHTHYSLQEGRSLREQIRNEDNDHFFFTFVG
jgi:hypothetical protein